MYRFAGAEFNEQRARDYNAFAARRFGHRPVPVKFVTSIEYGLLGRHDIGWQILISTNHLVYVSGRYARKVTRRSDEEMWRTMVHEVAHYLEHGHRSEFKVASRKAYDLWWEFAPTQEGWIRKRGRKAKRVPVLPEMVGA